VLDTRPLLSPYKDRRSPQPGDLLADERLHFGGNSALTV